MAIAARSLLRRNTKQRKRESTSSRFALNNNTSISNNPLQKSSSSLVLFNPNTIYNPKKVLSPNDEARVLYTEFPCKLLSQNPINDSCSFRGFVYFNKLNVVNPFAWDVNHLDNEAFNIARFALSEISHQQRDRLWLERILRYQIMKHEGKNHSMTLEVHDNSGKHMMYQIVVHQESGKHDTTTYSLQLYCWTCICHLPVPDPSGDASMSEFSVLYMSVMCLAYIFFGCVKYTYDWMFKIL